MATLLQGYGRPNDIRAHWHVESAEPTRPAGAAIV
jgi:hypothetical protein